MYYQEEDYRPQSEEQMCYEEARYECRKLSGDARFHGHGPVSLTVSYPYYCRATDAYAGHFISDVYRFASRSDAQAFIEIQFENGSFYEETALHIDDPTAVAPEVTITDEEVASF